MTKKVDYRVRYIITLNNRVVWAKFICGLCDGKIKGGCLQCRVPLARFMQIVRSRHWRAFQQNSWKEPQFTLQAAGDWLMEQGLEPLEIKKPKPKVNTPVKQVPNYWTDLFVEAVNSR